jgi:hypothetical protein
MSQSVVVLDEAEDELFEAKSGTRLSAPVLARSSEVQSTRPWNVFSRRHLPPHQSSIFPHPLMSGEFWSNGFRIRLCSLTTTRIFGSLVCPSTSATRLLARTAETVDGSPPPYYHAVNHCVEEDVRTRLSPIALNVIMRLAS